MAQIKLILYSLEDEAGKNIAAKLEQGFDYEPIESPHEALVAHRKGEVHLYGLGGTIRELRKLPIDPSLIVVASKHKSKAGNPTLTAHPTGNFGTAEMGGESHTLQHTNSQYLNQAMRLLSKNSVLGFDISREVTHHGPTNIRPPLFFVEVGSTPSQWKDDVACEAVAKTIDELLCSEPVDLPSAIGFGGTHYAPNFNKLSEKIALGHIMPKHAMDHLSKDIIMQMIDGTSPKPELAAIDWKGLTSQKRKELIGILDELGLPWERTSNIRVG